MGKVQVEADIPQTVNYVATTVSVGSTTTLSPGANATVTNSGTNQNAILNFGIPRGKSAYEQAVEGGYTGTEAEFKQALASDIGTVAGIASDVTQVAGIASAVSNVSANESDVTLVSDNMASVMATASNIGDVGTVAGIASDVSTVAGISSNVTSVAGNATNINTVAGDSSNIQTVATNISDVNTVATNISDVSSVAADLTNIDTAITNMAAIIAAPTAASNAATSAANAQTWAEGTDAQVAALGGTKSSKGWAARAEELVQSIGQVMHYKGSVATYAALEAITDADLGDVYNVLADDSNYAWTGSAWDMIGSSVDTSGLQPKTLETPITVGGVSQTTVEGALGAINTNTDGALKNIATGTDSLGILIDTNYQQRFAVGIGKGARLGYYGVTIGRGATSGENATAIGAGATGGQDGVAIGKGSKANSSGSTSIGTAAGSLGTGVRSINIGYQSYATAERAIQLGDGINSSQKTLQVYEYPLLDSTGKIPAARLTDMVGADGVNAGTAGAVPAPTATDNTKFLRGDGTWASPGGGSGHVVGEIVPSTLPITEAGFHLLDGALISGSGTYAAFVDYIGDLYDGGSYSGLFETEANWQAAVTAYGVCGKFVYDSVNNTVRLPKITGIIEGTTDTTALGDLVAAGLPNITGTSIFAASAQSFSGEGAFTKSTYGTSIIGNSVSNYYKPYFDASDSSSIYGNSATVQPQTIKVLFYIVIATSTKTAIEADIDQIASDLNGKTDTDLSNVTNTGTSTAAGWAMPSDVYEDLTLGASGSTYTAPSDGWVVLHATQTNTNGYAFLRNATAGELVSSQQPTQVNNFEIRLFIPIAKTQTYIIDYASINVTLFRFIYAVGSKSEAN